MQTPAAKFFQIDLFANRHRTSRGLETDMIEPFFMTAKSEQQPSHADDPNAVSSAAAAQGVSRIRRNCVVSLPSKFPIPRTHSVRQSGARRLADMDEGKSFLRRRPYMAHLFEFVALVDALYRKIIHAEPDVPAVDFGEAAILPSRGVCSSSALITLDAPNNTISINCLCRLALPYAPRIQLSARFLFSDTQPGIPAAFSRRRSSSSVSPHAPWRYSLFAIFLRVMSKTLSNQSMVR